MEINKEITVKLTEGELTEIIKQHLMATKNIEIDSVRFNIAEESNGYDYCSVLKGVTCYGKFE